MSIPHEFTHIKCSRVIIYFGIWTVRKWVDFDVNAKQNPIPYRIYSPSFCLFVSWHVGSNVTTQSYTILAHNMRISVTVLVVCRFKHMLLLGFFFIFCLVWGSVFVCIFILLLETFFPLNCNHDNAFDRYIVILSSTAALPHIINNTNTFFSN